MASTQNFRRSVIVTGASSGIGKALAIELARPGHFIGIVARRETELADVASAIRARGAEVAFRVLDVCECEATVATMHELDDLAGGIDWVIANAGVAGQRWAGNLDPQSCQNMIDVNVRGATNTLTALIPRMLERKHGHLIGISSMAAFRGMPRNALYSGTKAFLSVFLEGLRVDLAPDGIQVTEVRPGYVDTPMNAGQKSPRAFTMSSAEAAARIIAGIEQQKSQVLFPWSMAAIMRTLQLLPNGIFDRAIRRVRPPRDE